MLHGVNRTGAWLMGAALTGCVASAPDFERVSRDRAAIAGASSPADGASDGAVVAIVRKSGAMVCTGTVIAPRVVVTAAHCGVHATSYWDYDVAFGSDVRAAGLRLAVVDARAHPQFDPATFANDIAMLSLADEAPIAPRVLRRTPIASEEVGGEIRVVGYGRTRADATDEGVRRQGTTTLAQVTEKELKLEGGAAQPCAYDSGGPAFMTVGGAELLVGVTSRGDSACSTYSRETRVDAHLAFIDQYLADCAPATKELGARCLYDGHCRSGSCLSALDEPRIRYCSTACSSDAECAGLRCVASGSGKRCEKPRPTPGAPGARCESDGDCLDAECRTGSDGARFCARACSPMKPECPNDLACSLVDEIRFVCAKPPAAPESDSGCALSHTRTSDAAGAAALAAFITVLSRRRRASARILRQCSRGGGCRSTIS